MSNEDPDAIESRAPARGLAIQELGGERARIAVTAPLVIGRADGSGLRIADPRVSRSHACLTPVDGYLYIEDLASQNGTWVNNNRIQRLRLQAGDVLRIGRARYVVVRGDEPAGALSVQLVEEPVPSKRTVRPFDPSVFSGRSRLGESGWYDTGGQSDTPPIRSKPDIDAIQRQARNYAVVAEVNQRIQRNAEPGQMLHSVLEFVVDALNADRGVVAMVEDNPDNLHTRAVVYGDHMPPSSVIHISRTVARQVLTERCGVLSHDTHLDPKFSGSESMFTGHTRSLVVVHIPAGARVLGLIELSSSVPGLTFTDHELELMQVVASILGTELHKRELLEEQQRALGRAEEDGQKIARAELLIEKADRLEHLNAYVGHIFHEANNQVGSLRMFLETLQEASEDDHIAGSAQEFVHCIDSIRQLLSELRAEVQGTPEKRELRCSSLAELARSADRHVRYDEAVQGHRLELVVHSEPLVMLNEHKLRGVVVNLVRNAGQAIPHKQGQIRIQVEHDEQEARLRVKDNGSGIPPELLEEIFRAGYSTKSDGMGVGLHVCQTTAEEHGGRITVHTEVGEGTEFILHLPLVAETRPLTRSLAPDDERTRSFLSTAMPDSGGDDEGRETVELP